ncbi:hypothetical protein U0035_15400 [Niabella yanshanensis]|uniref:Uncharacterized protein n=1 Tax=Niabella yanshanensis TaxID=577386 RepID=A0ABZ0W1B5_9BACT|nr:hypothetical protein [Niabella yanshanensis]WQD37058.1 hypothetical protein U0035_15400 [Niabella yanshanensis]
MQQDQQVSNEIPFLHQHILSAAKIAAIAAFVSLSGSLAGILATLTRPLPAAPAAQEGFSKDDMQQLMQSSTYISAFISLAISVLAFYFLFRFSTLAKTGITNNSPVKLTTGLQSLGHYFKIWGIIMFLIIALFVLSLIGGMLGTAFGG